MPYKDPEKARQYAREKYQRYRNKAFELLGGKCVMCGEKDFVVLQLDHKIPILRNYRGDSGWRHFPKIIRNVLEREIYQLLCANCHVRKTKVEGPKMYKTKRGPESARWKGGYPRQLEKSNEWYRIKRTRSKK